MRRANLIMFVVYQQGSEQTQNCGRTWEKPELTCLLRQRTSLLAMVLKPTVERSGLGERDDQNRLPPVVVVL